MHGLYAIVDVDALAARGLGVIHFARAIVAARPALVQLRAKHLGPRETLSLLRQLRPVCSEAGVQLFANDRPDLAVLAGADGVHVGQHDLDVDEVRRFAPRLAVGVSTHNATELEGALASRPAYVAFGPVFATRSKEAPDVVVGLTDLARAARSAHAAGVPLVAIGGIDLGHARAIADSGADAGAVIAALLPEGEDLENITRRARALHAALGGEERS